MKNPNIICGRNQPIICDCEFIHVESWKNDDSYNPILSNQVDGKNHSQVPFHDDVVKK